LKKKDTGRTLKQLDKIAQDKSHNEFSENAKSKRKIIPIIQKY